MAATKVSEPTVHLSTVSFQISVLFVSVPRSISIPPFCEAAPVSSLLSLIMLSPMFTSLELTVVVVPLTVKSPVTITLPDVVTDAAVISSVLNVPSTVTLLNCTLSVVPTA